MSETIHIYLDGLLNDGDNIITSSKIKLWPALLIAVRFTHKSSLLKHGNIQNGLGLIGINSLAIAIEGFVGDILFENSYDYIKDNENSSQMKKILNSNWNSKKKIFKATFGKNLHEMNSYETIEILFLLRNYTAHGRTHRIKNISQSSAPNEGETFSVDLNYQKARSFFHNKGIISKSEKFSNVEALWQQPILNYFISETKLFLTSILDNVKSEKFEMMRSELENAYTVTL